ncbi:hypothetical protein B296_00033948 [Ensete ventricosum]|uniref:Uncharacterized protein n=1 Tax=Ensete ventricosum TaxID=4639 RepID=A0A427A6H6_ENSVE|nr:hypothetical protein B296_00033948 [Ensete ventricosum]
MTRCQVVARWVKDCSKKGNRSFARAAYYWQRVEDGTLLGFGNGARLPTLPKNVKARSCWKDHQQYDRGFSPAPREVKFRLPTLVLEKENDVIAEATPSSCRRTPCEQSQQDL